MSIQELEDFFRTHSVPQGTKLNAATTITEPDKYVKVNLDVVREWTQDLNKCPSYWHLCQLAAILSGADKPEMDQ